MGVLSYQEILPLSLHEMLESSNLKTDLEFDFFLERAPVYFAIILIIHQINVGGEVELFVATVNPDIVDALKGLLSVIILASNTSPALMLS